MQLSTLFYTIGSIPIMEMVPTSLQGKPAPLAIFYHGYTNNKESMATYALELAMRGFRAVLPDAPYHGKRAQGPVTFDNPMPFIHALRGNIEEFTDLTRYYQQRELIQDDIIVTSGMSMGAMTTSMLLRTHPEIKAASLLMGSAYQTVFMEDLAKKAVKVVGPQAIATIQPFADMIEDYQNFLKLNDLGLDLQAIAGRPIYVWHAQDDEVVPYKFDQQLIEEAQRLPEGQSVYNHITETGGHRVPYQEIVHMAEFLAAASRQDPSQIGKMVEAWQV